MLFAKKIVPTQRPAPTGGLRPIDPSQFRHVAGGTTEAPKNGWNSCPVTTDGGGGDSPSAPKNGW